MAVSFPPDIVVLDSDGFIHARLVRGKKGPRIVQAKAYRLSPDTFVPAVVTPQLTNESALAEALRRLRIETGRWDRASLLLPDSWFRINILDLPSLPVGAKDAQEMVRWSLKRTMPIDPQLLRLRYEVLSRTPSHARVLAITAIDETLAAIERVFNAAGVEVVIIEPIGMNIWNAITSREPNTARDRIFFYVRQGEFTTAAFRGPQPLFIRSRNLDGERTLEQEIKLSASYLRDTLRTESVEQCYVSGNSIAAQVASIIGEEFGAPVHTVSLADCSDGWPEDIAAYESELAACTGVFTA
jgi:Tfp pilus assembly PilM family ATPase